MKVINIFVFSIFIILFAFSDSFAQEKVNSIIKGAVIDKETGNPLEAASIYLTQTTIGTVANKQGMFTFEVKTPGNYELVVSMVGYELQKSNLYVERGKKYDFQFQLVPKPVLIKEVETLGRDLEKWKRNLEIFTNKFLGDFAAADSCTMQNLEYLDFEWKGGFLIARSSSPIIIVNKYLGYKINCELLHFEYNPRTKAFASYIIPLFIELTPENANQRNEWLENRKLMYLGSPEHFLKSLRNNKLEEEGYKVYHVTGIGNDDQKLINVVETWEDIMYDKQVSDDPAICFEHYLRIVYKRVELSYAYQRYTYFSIDQNGIADNHPPFVCFGFWTKNGVANLLPRNYLPEDMVTK